LIDRRGFKVASAFADGSLDMNPLATPVVANSGPEHLPNRRQQERISVRTPVRIVSIHGQPAASEAVCTSISFGGVAFETDAVLEVGRVVEFEFVPAADQPCRYAARVLYRDGNCYGAYYVNADGTDICPLN
jgi:hypothetical protein